ncbi:MAG: PspA-associated protein PspAB [Thermoleophilaceae bacterium]
MGFLDALFGGGKKLKAPAPDRLFAMTTAHVTLQTGLGMESSGAAGIVFQPLATADFERILKEAEELLAGTAEDSGSTLESDDDAHGYRWIILRDPDFEDIVVSLNTISTELQAGGYGERLLCAVFPFEDGGRRVYFIYNYKRGTFYPFVPAGGEQQRDSEAELRLKAQLERELPLEAELTRWFPLWEIPL